jgi:hypothetical protein
MPVKHHTRLWTLVVTVIFVASGISWIFNFRLGLGLLILGGIVFGVTYKS